jgi:hypothetical protein
MYADHDYRKWQEKYCHSISLHWRLFVNITFLLVKLTEHENLCSPECTAWWSRRYDLLENDL